MSIERTITVHDVTEDGLPDMDALINRVAFIFDGSVIQGWPIVEDGMIPANPLEILWEGSENRVMGTFTGVRYWIEFPVVAHHLGDATKAPS